MSGPEQMPATPTASSGATGAAEPAGSRARPSVAGPRRNVSGPRSNSPGTGGRTAGHRAWVSVTDRRRSPSRFPRRASSLLEFGLRHVRELTDIGPDTRNRYGGQLRTLDRELTALLGRAPTVGGLSETDVRRWVNWRVAQPGNGAPKTVSSHHGLRPDNPCAGHRLPAEPVQRHDHNDVAVPHVVQQRCQPRPVLPDPRQLVGEHPGAARLLERVPHAAHPVAGARC